MPREPEEDETLSDEMASPLPDREAMSIINPGLGRMPIEAVEPVDSGPSLPVEKPGPAVNPRS